jgi:outer membrane protein OmpA-like peptidoglycan-associated protein
MADRKVSIAESLAMARYAEDQRAMLSEESDAIRLQARTREADQALDDAAVARGDAARAREETAMARSSEVRARTESADARRAATTARTANNEALAQAARDAAEYERRIDDLQAASTERGLVLTLRDVLFATDSATLQEGPNGNLDKLVLFLAEYPTRSVVIEGHTDNVGTADYNRKLSQRRADSVMSYLLEKGVPAQSLSAQGMGIDHPVASNATASGRQQNRRVEIIIQNPAESDEGPTH